jgi:glycine/sarcosine N-methyltransferase
VSEAVAGFYDELAGDYDRIFESWAASVAWQGGILAALLARLDVAPGARVLDCTCGIGTQLIGLARAGYAMHGTDVSPGAIERAEREVRAASLEATLGVADVRSLPGSVPSGFDAVVSFDNSLAHMLDDGDLTVAVRSMAAVAAPGAPILVSLRPYDELAADRPVATHPRVAGEVGARSVSFQLWDWDETGTTYRLDQLTLREAGGQFTTTVATTTLRAIRRAEIEAAFAGAGLTDVARLEPSASGYYQPITVGRVRFA